MEFKEETDPMFIALLQNFVQLESVLRTLTTSIAEYENCMQSMCRGTQKLAISVHNFCSEDPALKQDTNTYISAVKQMCGAEGVVEKETKSDPPQQHSNDEEGNESSLLRELVSNLNLKVLEPLQVNVDILKEIRKRLEEREKIRKSLRHLRRLLRKNSQEFKTKTEKFDDLTRVVFEELTALYQHRFDFVRGPYQALKRCQFQFFQATSECLGSVQQLAPRPSTSLELPETPSPLKETRRPSIDNTLKDVVGGRDRDNVFTRMLKGNGQGTGNSNQRNQPDPKTLIATPEVGSFRECDDLPAAGKAYMRLGRASGEDAKGTHLKESSRKIGSTRVLSATPLGTETDGKIKLKLKLGNSRSSSLRNKNRAAQRNSISLSQPPSASGNIVVSAPSTTTDGEIVMPAPSSTTDGEAVIPVPSTTTHGEIVMPAPSSTTDGEIVIPAPSSTTDGEIVIPAPSSTTDGEIVMPAPSSTTDGEIVMPAPSTTTDDEIVMPAPSSTTDGEIVMPAPSSTTDGEIVMLAPSSTTDGEIVMPAPSSTTDGEIVMPAPSSTTDGEIVMPAPSTTTDGEAVIPVPSTTTHGEIVMPAPSSTTDGEIVIPAPSSTTDGEIVMSAPSTTTDGEIVIPAPSSTTDGEIVMSAPSTTTDGEIVMPAPSSTTDGEIVMPAPSSTPQATGIDVAESSAAKGDLIGFTSDTTDSFQDCSTVLDKNVNKSEHLNSVDSTANEVSNENMAISSCVNIGRATVS